MEQINVNNFNAINQYAGRNPLIDNMAIIAAEYMPEREVAPFV